MKKIMIGALAAVLVGASLASVAAGMSPEDQIKNRKAAYRFAAWNMGKIKDQVVDKSVAYDKAQVQAAANAIAAVANSGMGALYGPGTDKAVGGETTKVKPELFKDTPEVIRLSQNFGSAANQLAEAAAGGDEAAIGTAFAAVGDACKSCHDKFRAK